MECVNGIKNKRKKIIYMRIIYLNSMRPFENKIV